MSRGTSDRGPLRVLIAEDKTIVRLDLRAMLEDQGLVVCGEAREASKPCRSHVSSSRTSR
jgi:AmiR/NasT family two-component response regulator